LCRGVDEDGRHPPAHAAPSLPSHCLLGPHRSLRHVRGYIIALSLSIFICNENENPKFSFQTQFLGFLKGKVFFTLSLGGSEASAQRKEIDKEAQAAPLPVPNWIY
jgi:hypothetical protein